MFSQYIVGRDILKMLSIGLDIEWKVLQLIYLNPEMQLYQGGTVSGRFLLSFPSFF